MWLCPQIDVNAGCLQSQRREYFSDLKTHAIAATACVPHLLSDTGLGEPGGSRNNVYLCDGFVFFLMKKRGKKKWLYIIIITCAPIFN